jgi:hypothetical protein
MFCKPKSTVQPCDRVIKHHTISLQITNFTRHKYHGRKSNIVSESVFIGLSRYLCTCQCHHAYVLAMVYVSSPERQRKSTTPAFHAHLLTTTKTEDQMESRLLLNVVITQGTTILQLLTSKDQSLLVRWDTLLILDL